MSTRNMAIVYDDIGSKIGYAVGFGPDVSADNVNFMITYARGLVYVCITEQQAERLQIPYMVWHGARTGKRFGVSVDHITTTTGISAGERAGTIQAFLAPDAVPEDFKRPGHVFPLIESEGSSGGHQGIVEAVMEMSRRETGEPVCFMCEILNESGEIAGLPELRRFAIDHGMRLVKASEALRRRGIA